MPWKYQHDVRIPSESLKHIEVMREHCLRWISFSMDVYKHRRQWGVKGGAILFSHYCSFAVFRSSSENWLSIDLNRSSKQHIHVRELTHEVREFCLKRAVNYISKGHGAIKLCFKLHGLWAERKCDFFQSFFCCSLSVFDRQLKIGFI